MTTRASFFICALVCIGRESAMALASSSYKLVLLTRHGNRFEKLAKRLEVDTHLFACDINHYAELKAKLSKILIQFADINVLLNNVGLAVELDNADQVSWNV